MEEVRGTRGTGTGGVGGRRWGDGDGGTREGEKQCCESPETTGRGTWRHTGHWGAGDSTEGALGAPHLPPAPPAQVMIVPGLSSRAWSGKWNMGSPPHPAAGWSEWRGYNNTGAKGVHLPSHWVAPACLAGAAPSLQASQGAGHGWQGVSRAFRGCMGH